MINGFRQTLEMIERAAERGEAITFTPKQARMLHDDFERCLEIARIEERWECHAIALKASLKNYSAEWINEQIKARGEIYSYKFMALVSKFMRGKG